MSSLGRAHKRGHRGTGVSHGAHGAVLPQKGAPKGKGARGALHGGSALACAHKGGAPRERVFRQEHGHTELCPKVRTAPPFPTPTFLQPPYCVLRWSKYTERRNVVFIRGIHRSCETPVDPHSSRGCEDHAAFVGRVLVAMTKVEVGPEGLG